VAAQWPRCYKIILFGSYARGDFVDEPQNGYQSDFDLLVVVSDEKLTDVADYWFEAEQRLLPTTRRSAASFNLIVDDLDGVNQGLGRRPLLLPRESSNRASLLYEVPGPRLQSG
jgi:hypothetical protein